jgi:serine protease
MAMIKNARFQQALLLAGLALGLAVPPAASQELPSGDAVELIVLLAAGPSTPTPEALADDVNQGRSPFDLPVQPIGARLALPFRASGGTLAHLQASPDSPRARLERYVILTFPSGVNLEEIKTALAASSKVLNVEENVPFTLSTVPSDPGIQPTGDPTTYQWGSYTLNLPAAWDRIHGHAYVGLTDTGLEVNHPDLRPYHFNGTSWVFDGGSFRPQFSYDFGYNDANVDEADRPSNVTLLHLGHGTHTSGIIAASTNNGTGVAGACWNCSLMMAKISKVSSAGYNSDGREAPYAAGYTWLIDHGAQVVSASLGSPGGNCTLYSMICSALAYAEERDVTLFSASGNSKDDLNFPANDSRVIAVGGIAPDSSFWTESVCPQPGYIGTTECGSNYTKTPGSAMQTLVTPAKNVLSTTYEGWVYLPGKCSDGSAYGLCTGTSMSSPYAAGIGALVRSANPLLTKANVRTILINNASRAGSWDPKFGYGIPNADASVQSAMGTVGGRVLANRLTPLFSLYSSSAEDFYYTTVPQMGAAAFFDPVTPYGSVGPTLGTYAQFPGIDCVVSPCPRAPGASVYIFTSDHAPYIGAPSLGPLYRMSYKGTNPNGNVNHRDTTYTTQANGITAFRGAGYDIDGLEGYIFPACTPEPACIPSGTVRLLRRYHPQRDDYAIFPESELAQMVSQGYTSTGSGNGVLGYVYPNVDSDSDGLIDGFELLAGTNPLVADSDCDGIPDGQEILNYPYTDPLGPGCAAAPVWVSANGNDGNNCNYATPCRTFSGALARIASGGEIDVQDSGDFGPVTINKSVTLVSAGPLGGIQTGTGSAITISAGPSDKVVLRGLTLDGIGTGASGVSFTAGGALYVENCTINGFGQYGIDFAPASGTGKLFVTGAILRNNGGASTGGGLHLLSSTAPGFVATVEGLRSENNVFGLKAEGGGTVTIRNSIAANNGYSGFSASNPAGSSLLRMLIEESVSTHNGTNGILANGLAEVTLSNVALTDNQTGLNPASGGLILSFGNNKVQGNTTDGNPSQTLTNQ